jgi:hypothetical protein
LAQQKSLQTHFAAREIAHAILTGPAQVANRFVVDRGHVDRARISAAHQAGQRHRVAPIGLQVFTRSPAFRESAMARRPRS